MALEQITFAPAPPPTPPSPSPRDVKSLDLRSRDINRVLESIEIVAPKWYAYHAKAIRTLGVTKYLDLVDLAKSGNNPPTLLSWLLKEELCRS